MILDAVLLSAKVALCCVLLVVVPGTWLGWLLVRKKLPCKPLLVSLTNIPLVIPPVATGYILLKLLGRNGIVGNFLVDWFGLQLTFNWFGAALASAVVAFPLMVRAVRIAVEQVDPKLEQAALSLGAGPLKTFFLITFPLSFPGIVAGAILAFARSLGEFGATITIAGNIPGETQTLPLAIHQLLQMPDGDSQAMVLVLISIVLALVSTFAAEMLVVRSLCLAKAYSHLMHKVMSLKQAGADPSAVTSMRDQEVR